jgi:hypothetical protein
LRPDGIALRATSQFDGARLAQSCGRWLIQTKGSKPGDVGDARVTNEVADATVKVHSKLMANCVVLDRKTVDMAAVPHQGKQLVAILTGEHSPSHLNIAVEYELRRWRGCWFRQ